MLNDKFLKYCALKELKWIIRMIQEGFYKKCKCEKGKVNLYLYENTNHRLWNI